MNSLVARPNRTPCPAALYTSITRFPKELAAGFDRIAPINASAFACVGAMPPNAEV